MTSSYLIAVLWDEGRRDEGSRDEGPGHAEGWHVEPSESESLGEEAGPDVCERMHTDARTACSEHGLTWSESRDWRFYWLILSRGASTKTLARWIERQAILGEEGR